MLPPVAWYREFAMQKAAEGALLTAQLKQNLTEACNVLMGTQN